MFLFFRKICCVFARYLFACFSKNKIVKLFILIVNNNSNPDMAFGGSHWSLLLFVRTLNEFWYFDSYANSNQRVATSVARNFATALGASNSYSIRISI